MHQRLPIRWGSSWRFEQTLALEKPSLANVVIAKQLNLASHQVQHQAVQVTSGYSVRWKDVLDFDSFSNPRKL